MKRRVLNPPRVGVLLMDAQGRLVHYNAEAALALDYPEKPRIAPSLDAISSATQCQFGKPHTPALPSTFAITSGRRQYVGRAFQVQLNGKNGRSGAQAFPATLILLDRAPVRSVTMAPWSELFHLTGRESEAVGFLLKGLTSKEIAEKMGISPSTVKSFLKFVMVKVGASNRTGIIAKIFGQAG